MSRRGATSVDLMILPMEGDAARGWTPGTPTVFLSTPADEAAPMFSPDGRWIAYSSTEAGGASSMSMCVRFPAPAADGASPRQAAAIPGGRPRRTSCCS